MSSLVFSMPYKTFVGCIKSIKNIVGTDQAVSIATDPNGDIYFLYSGEYTVKLKTSGDVKEHINNSFNLSDLIAIKGTNKGNVEFFKHDDISFRVDAAGSSYIEKFASILTADSVCKECEYKKIDSNIINNFSRIIASKDVQEWFIYNSMKYVKYNKSTVSYLSPVFSAYTKNDSEAETHYIPVQLIKAGVFKKPCSIYKDKDNYQINQDDSLFISYLYKNGVAVDFPKISFTDEFPISHTRLFDAFLNVSSYSLCRLDVVKSKNACYIVSTDNEKSSSIDIISTGEIKSNVITARVSPDILIRALHFLNKDEISLIKMKLFIENKVCKFVCLCNDESSVMVSCLR